MSKFRVHNVPLLLRVMFFVDGGYLRDGFKKHVGHGEIDFEGLVEDLIFRPLHPLPVPEGRSELTRVYYYDAIVDPSDDIKRHKQQREYFHEVGLIPSFEVKLGRLVKTGKGEYRQKGVDILIAIDMLTKAFQNFYDIAVLIGGDDDFVDLINTVKNMANKKVYGVAFQHNVSQRLLESFDVSYVITKPDCRAWTRRKKA